MAETKLGPRTKDRVGHKVGGWTILKFSGYRLKNGVKKEALWVGQCSCGVTKTQRFQDFKTYLTCKGCASTKHGACIIDNRGTETYKSWIQMKCKSKEKGIPIHSKWLKSFKNFLRDMGERPDNYILARKNTMLGYTPDNVLWASRRASSGRSRKNHTGYAGVSFDEATGRYRALINIQGQKIHLGRYDSDYKAALAYDKAIVDYGLELDCLNFPEVVESLTGERK